MTGSVKWIPTGCAVIAAEAGTKSHGPGPLYPADLLLRINHLDLGAEDLYLAWELVRLGGSTLDSGLQRALVLLILAARLVASEGSTRLPLAGSHLHKILSDFSATPGEREAVVALIDEARKAEKSENSSSLTDLFGPPGAYRPLIISGDYLYTQRLYSLEIRVGSALQLRLAGDDKMPETAETGWTETGFEEAFRDVLSLPPHGTGRALLLDDEQKLAVRAALEGKITVISGRPGSGKTSVVASILRVLARVGSPPLESVALAAPTGKAADRMRRSIAEHLAAIPDISGTDQTLAAGCPPSSTLHRLLGYSPGRDFFRHNEHNPLAEELVIVDESSMIDLAMMDRLLRALRPEARLILLGDADQLPSIEAGAVLRDLCRSNWVKKSGRAVILKNSYRARAEDPAGKQILSVAAAVNEGLSLKSAPGGTYPKVTGTVSEIAFTGVEHLEPDHDSDRNELYALWLNKLTAGLEGLDQRLEKVYSPGSTGFSPETTEELGALLDHYEKFKILCVTRATAGATGSEAVNRWFHQRWFVKRYGENKMVNAPTFLIGEPVMVTRNDYNLRLYNGDSGLVLNIAPEVGSSKLPARPMAVFPRSGGFAAFPLDALRSRLEPAWAVTVHKAQGSEYDHLALILPEVYVRPLTRELLYTAITRARKSVVIAGTSEVFDTGIANSVERASGLFED
jgi:exodeoxyribonuclease V alpha subunit